MPRVYIRKYQRELEDLVYYLDEYPELRRYLNPEQREKVEERRQQLIDWLWRQMGRKDDPPLLVEPEDFSEEVVYPPKGTPEGRRMILHLYEMWRAKETGRNPGEKAKSLLMKKFGFKTKEALEKYLQRARKKVRADNRKTVARDSSDDGCPF